MARSRSGLGWATMTLLVPHPPGTPSEALPVAAEMTALCRDVLSVDGPAGAFGYESGGSVAGPASCLVNRPLWTLWWS